MKMTYHLLLVAISAVTLTLFMNCDHTGKLESDEELSSELPSTGDDGAGSLGNDSNNQTQDPGIGENPTDPGGGEDMGNNDPDPNDDPGDTGDNDPPPVVNLPPTISPIDNQLIVVGSSPAPFQFSADEGGSAQENDQTVVVAVESSSNTGLVPLSAVQIDCVDQGNGCQGQVIVKPVSGKLGTAIITLAVGDGKHTVYRDFKLQVAGIMRSHQGGQAGEFLGGNGTPSAAAGGDVNRDGYPDYILGSTGFLSGGKTFGKVTVFSGKDGSKLYEVLGRVANTLFGSTVNFAGDVNADGYADFIVGAPNEGASGAAYIYSGRTGEQLNRRTVNSAGSYFGTAVSSGGDIDGDGYDEVAISLPLATVSSKADVGRVYVYSGRTGAIIQQFKGAGAGVHFGEGSLDLSADVNKDGKADLIVGCRYCDRTSDGQGPKAGRVYVYSGATGEVLYMFTGENDNDQMSRAQYAGDVNKDGYPDIFVASSEHALRKGKVYLYSGKNGSLLFSAVGQGTGDEFGSIISSGKVDFDGDGYIDLFVGARGYNCGSLADCGKVYIYSGRNYSQLLTKTGTTMGERFGQCLVPIGDINKDGRGEVLAASGSATGPAGGNVGLGAILGIPQ